MNIESGSLSDRVELRDLTYFLAVCRHGQLTRAATALGVAQPTLSHAMARLEQALGQRLWHRPPSRRAPLRPTPAGDSLRLRAVRILSEVDAIADDVAAVAGLERGRLSIGCIPSLMASLLPQALAALHADHPGVDITVQTVRSESWRQTLDQALVDAVLVATDGTTPTSYATKPCGHQGFVAVVRRDHDLATAHQVPLRQLAHEAMLMVPLDTVTGSLVARSCQEAGFDLHPSLTLDSPEGLRELVRLGCGISILPQGYVAPGDPDLCCIPITRPRLRRPVTMIHHGDLAQMPALAAFYDQVHRLDGS